MDPVKSSTPVWQRSNPGSDHASPVTRNMRDTIESSPTLQSTGTPIVIQPSASTAATSDNPVVAPVCVVKNVNHLAASVAGGDNSENPHLNSPVSVHDNHDSPRNKHTSHVDSKPCLLGPITTLSNKNDKSSKKSIDDVLHTNKRKKTSKATPTPRAANNCGLGSPITPLLHDDDNAKPLNNKGHQAQQIHPNTQSCYTTEQASLSGLGKHLPTWDKYRKKLGFNTNEALAGYIMNQLSLMEAIESVPTNLLDNAAFRGGGFFNGHNDQWINLKLKIKTSDLVDCNLIVQNGAAIAVDVSLDKEAEKKLTCNTHVTIDSKKRPSTRMEMSWKSKTDEANYPAANQPSPISRSNVTPTNSDGKNTKSQMITETEEDGMSSKQNAKGSSLLMSNTSLARTPEKTSRQIDRRPDPSPSSNAVLDFSNKGVDFEKTASKKTRKKKSLPHLPEQIVKLEYGGAGSQEALPVSLIKQEVGLSEDTMSASETKNMSSLSEESANILRLMEDAAKSDETKSASEQEDMRDETNDSAQWMNLDLKDFVDSYDGDPYTSEPPSEPASGDEIVFNIRASSERPPRSVKRKAYRRKDLYSSDEDNHNDVKPVIRRSKKTTKTSLPCESKDNISLQKTPKVELDSPQKLTPKKRGRPRKNPQPSKNKRKSIKKEDVDFIPDKSDDSNEENEDIEELKQLDELPMQEQSPPKKKKRRRISNKRKSSGKQNKENAEQGENDSDSDEGEGHISETGEEIIDRITLWKPRPRFVKMYPHTYAGADYEVLQKYAYPSRGYTIGFWRCHLCSYIGKTVYMITHLNYRHDFEMEQIEKEITNIKAQATLSPVPEHVNPYKGTVDGKVCLICCHEFESSEIKRHVFQVHGKYRADNWTHFVGTAASLDAIGKNLVEFNAIVGGFYCKICDEVPRNCFSQNKIMEHLQFHTKFECDSCELEFKAEREYTEHISKEHIGDDAINTCELCEFQCLDKKRLKMHSLLKHAPKLVCTMPQCDHTCYTETDCRRHFLEQHLTKMQEGKPDLVVSAIQNKKGAQLVQFKCKLCSDMVEGTLHSRAQFRNLLCIEVMLNMHFEDFHQDYVATAFPKEDMRSCRDCGKWCHIFQSYEEHKVFCKGPRKCPFEKCNKFFTHLEPYRYHVQWVHQRAPVLCDTCGMNLHSNHGLKEHIRMVHNKSKPCVCDICARAFARPDQLKIHVRTHTGEKPYKCDYCDFRGAQRNNIISHMKVKHREAMQKE